MKNDSARIAVILMNLGGPDNLNSVKPFLFNLFYDKAIITLPNPLRWIIAKMISRLRHEKSKNIYRKIGSKSPILDETQRQAMALERNLEQKCPAGNIYRTFVAMRYWHPFSSQVVRRVMEFQPDKIVLMPLYPHYSSTTTQSSLNDWHGAMREYWHNLPALRKLYTKRVPYLEIIDYHDSEFFIESYADLIRETLKRLPSVLQGNRELDNAVLSTQEPREDNSSAVSINLQAALGKGYKVLFSAHSLPQKIINKGDPYQRQIERSVQLIADSLGLTSEQYIICYQSKVGPLKWLGPSTEEILTELAKQRLGAVLVPIAFVSEHSETLVELDIDYKNLAEELQLPFYLRVPTLRDHPRFIEGLSELCFKLLGVEARWG